MKKKILISSHKDSISIKTLVTFDAETMDLIKPTCEAIARKLVIGTSEEEKHVGNVYDLNATEKSTLVEHSNGTKYLFGDTLSKRKAKLLIFSNLEKQGLEKGSISKFEVKNSSIQKLE